VHDCARSAGLGNQRWFAAYMIAMFSAQVRCSWAVTQTTAVWPFLHVQHTHPENLFPMSYCIQLLVASHSSLEYLLESFCSCVRPCELQVG
jgi:hypothetical protein